MRLAVSQSLHIPNMPLSDLNASMMDALGESELEDLGLKTPFQEVLNTQTKHVIELHLALIKHTDTHQTSEQGVT